MADSNTFLRSGTQSTFVTSLFSISLVLFFLSLFLSAALFTRHMLREAQEDFEIMVMLADEVNGDRKDKLVDKINKELFTKQVRYVSRDQAAKEFMESVGQDFLEIMDGINPMRASLNIKLKAEYMQQDSLEKVKKYFATLPGITEINSPDAEMAKMHHNSGVFTRIAAGIALIVVVIAWFIIRGTIRLSIYSKRLTIRSMQLIGATNGFIRRPFISLGMFQGILGGILANALLAGLIWVLPLWESRLIELRKLLYNPEFLIMSGGIVIFGAILGWLSSSVAVNRFLNRPLDQIV